MLKNAGSIKYTLEPQSASTADKVEASTKKILSSMAVLSVPEGKTVEDMSKGENQPSPSERSGQRPAVLQWREPSRFIKDIREEAKENGRQYEKRRSTWVEHPTTLYQPEART